MSSPPRDPDLTLSELRKRSIDSLLKDVATARRAGDVERARPQWEACVIRATARVETAVKGFRTLHGDRVATHDRDDVVNDALERACRRMIHTLDKLNELSFRAAMAACAENACRDHFRRLGSYQKGLAGSLDAPAYDEGDAGRYDDALHRAAERRQDNDDAAFEAADRLERAVRDLPPSNRTTALGMRRLGLEYDEIAEELGTSRDNAYQLVCRAIKDLRKLMEP
jgi:RNA polymerase sigma factor (sigma-70 family)